MRFIIHPGETPAIDRLGGKAAALAVLHGSDLAVPAWFVLAPEAFAASLSEGDRRAAGDDGDWPECPPGLAGVQLSSAVLLELNEALVKLCPAGELVAVRSSALDEDGRECSFAGQLESFLLVPAAEVPAKVVAVWQSAFSERVQAYRAQHGLVSGLRAPAVLVQRMVLAEAAGVAFGADPVSGRLDVAVVAAVRGLGSSLVDGSRDADTWHVSVAGEIEQRQLANGGRDAPAPARPGQLLPALDDSQVRAVAGLVRQAGQIFGRPQDIEWAYAAGRLYLLQSRPVTALAGRADLNIWDNSNIIESYSGVTLPLTFSFARRAYTGVYRQFCQMLAVPKAKIAAHENTFRNMLGLIRGRVYYNLLNWYRVLALLPGFTLNRRFMEQMMGVKEELPAEILAELGHASVSARLKDGLDVTGSLAALVGNHWLLPRKIRRFYARLDEALEPPSRALEAMTAPELAAHFDELEKKLLTRWDAPLLNDFFAMIFYGVLRKLMTLWVNDAEGTLQNDLLCGEGGMISAEPAERIVEMAGLAATNAGLVRQLGSGSLPAMLKAMDEVPTFKAAYLGYLAKFGDRCLGELKLESLPLHEDPMVLLRAVGQLAGRPTVGLSAASPAGGPDVRRAAEARVDQALAGRPVRRGVLRWVLRHTRARVRDRENLRFERTRLFGRVRRIFIELGRRFHAQGWLNEPREIFLLEVDEVREVATGGAPGTGLQALVTERQAQFAHYQETDPPPNRFTTHGPVDAGTVWEGVPVLAVESDPLQRKGIGCCPGVVRGRVRKILDPRNAVIYQGEILVADRTDPGWIMLFPAAAGLLIERGSLLSHSAIVAREMRIPAIVSIDGLMSWLDDGDEVEFDGATGVLRRVGKFSTCCAGAPSGVLPAAQTVSLSCAASAELTPIAP